MNDGMSQPGLERLREGGFEVITDKVEQDNLEAFINENQVAALLVRSATKVRQDLIDACPSLKIVGRGGVGLDNIDVQYAETKGIKVVNTPGASSKSVAELAMSSIFGMARFLHAANRDMPQQGEERFKELKKTFSKGFEVSGKVLGIIGFGGIGQSLASYGIGCGMEVIAHDPFINMDKVNIRLHLQGDNYVDVDVHMVSKEELFRRSDFISLHVPKPADGGSVIGAAEIAQLKDGVCLVNTARGGVIDEKALIAGLESGKVAHAALDVFVNEPTPYSDILHHPNISLSPHIGGSTREAQERIGLELADKVISFFQS